MSDLNPTPIYDAAAWDHGFAPIVQPTMIPAPCYVCVDRPISWVPNVPTDGLCMGCRNEAKANRDDARDELVSTHYTGHGITHGTYRPDVRMGLL